MRLAIFGLFFILIFASHVQAKCRAVLVNGGINAYNNHKIHETQIREMYKSLRKHGCSDEDIHVFSASGRAGALEFRDDPVKSDSKFVGFDYKYNDGKRVKNLYSADKKTLSKKISEIAKSAGPADKLFVYMSDHGYGENPYSYGYGGARKPLTKGLVPWTDDLTDLFTEKDLENAISQAPKETQINIWADCCYCGVFNKVKRENTCVATSTDEYHPGNYFWSEQKVEKDTSVKAYFAGDIRMRERPTLGGAAQAASLRGNDNSYMAGAMITGCFVGPRNSAEQYAFNVIGFGDKIFCRNDLKKLVDVETPVKEEMVCKMPSLEFHEFNQLKELSRELRASAQQVSSQGRDKIKVLTDEMDSILKAIESSKEYEEIVRDVQKTVLESGDELSVWQAVRVAQANANIKVSKLIRNSKLHEVYMRNQRAVIEEVFKSKATPEQKTEYERRKACLKESLF